MKALTYIPLFLMCLLFASCQKIDLGEDPDAPEGTNLVTFKVRQFEQREFDKAKSRATVAQTVHPSPLVLARRSI